jgi:nucleoid-associated protein YgaU
MKLTITRNLLLSLGCAVSFSSCELLQKKQDPATDPYATANPYAQGTQNQGYPAYGAQQSGAYDPAAGGYAQPNYSEQQPYTQQPYTQPPAGGAGYAGGYDAPNHNTGGGNYGNASGRTHKVVRGDTLSSISRRYGTSVSELMRANNLNSDLIREGQSIAIP